MAFPLHSASSGPIGHTQVLSQPFPSDHGLAEVRSPELSTWSSGGWRQLPCSADQGNVFAADFLKLNTGQGSGHRSWVESSLVTEMTTPCACTVGVPDPPGGSEPHTRGPAKEMNVRRRLKTVCTCRWVPAEKCRRGALGGLPAKPGPWA